MVVDGVGGVVEVVAVVIGGGGGVGVAVVCFRESNRLESENRRHESPLLSAIRTFLC